MRVKRNMYERNKGIVQEEERDEVLKRSKRYILSQNKLNNVICKVIFSVYYSAILK